MADLSAATFAFYEDLEEDNSKAFWTTRRSDYDEHVFQPLRSLLAELEPEFGSAKIFRPHRDVRFSADKSPYKTHQGAYVAVGEALGWYVQVSADGLYTGGGFYQADAARLANFRHAVVADGSTLRAMVDELGWTVGGEQVKTAPRGFSKDHPQIDLLRHKSFHLTRDYGRVLPRDVTEAVATDWRAVSPIVGWLDSALSGESWRAHRPHR